MTIPESLLAAANAVITADGSVVTDTDCIYYLVDVAKTVNFNNTSWQKAIDSRNSLRLNDGEVLDLLLAILNVS
jgi:hypothetical protein